MFTLIAVYNLLSLIKERIPNSYRVEIFIENDILGISVFNELRGYTQRYTFDAIGNLMDHGVLLDTFIEKANIGLNQNDSLS